MPKISLTIRSASRDNFLATQGIPSFFEAVMWCMHEQTFTDFEFIYVDTHYDENRERFATINPGFQVKHVPVHKDHRYWYDQGWAFMAAATNTAILYADGELIVSLDDAEFFHDDLLARYWAAYENETFMHAAHLRLRNIKLKTGWPVMPIEGDVYDTDSRRERLRGATRRVHNNGSWLYAGKSFSLKDALTLNGFNERLDGNSTLEDAEFGVRLEKLGRKFLYDTHGCVYILDHRSYVDDPDAKKISRGFIAVENYGYVKCVKETDYLVANRGRPTPAQLAIINRETKKYRDFDMYCPENAERLRIWAATPTFDLRKQREALRRSPDWKW